MRDFLREYTGGADDLAAFYARAPRDLWTAPAAARPWRPELVQAIKAFQAARGTMPDFSGNEAVIITGQQPGIFTGPLYTIYKAVTAIVLARKLREQFSEPVVPVFWIGSEDHDFEEACTTHFLTKQHEALTVRYRPEGPVDALPMYRVPLEPSIHEVIDQAASQTNGSEFRDEVAQVLHETLDASDSLADWTARLLIRLFAETPLVFFTPHLPEARAITAEIIAKEIREPLETTALLNEAALRLERIGFQPQVVKGHTECCFFFEIDDRRRKVVYEKGAFFIPEADQTVSTDEMLGALEHDPARFSPNVALRCIVQQHLFPAASYVAGPGELGYWAQLKEVFERFDLPMPVVYPRVQCALTTIKLNKLLKKFGLTIGELEQDEDALLETAMRKTAANPGFAFEREKRQALEGLLGELTAGLEKDAPTAAAMAKSLSSDVGAKLDRIERAILASDHTKNDTTRRQLRRLRNTLAPNRKPQERVYNVFSYLFEQGWGLIPRLIDEIDVESFEMTEVEL